MRGSPVTDRASFRMKRQAVPYGDQSLPYTAIVHEAALRLGHAGPDVTREQLHHLIEMGEHDNVTVLAIPFGQADFPAAGQPITYATGRVPELDTVALDTDHGCDYLYAEAQLVRYRTVLDRLESWAFSPARSRIAKNI